MGERQRVMIARALSTEPKLVLADEPTGSLDTQRGGEVLELLSEICRERGAAVLLVTHDPQATAFADRVHALRDGRLVGLRAATRVLRRRLRRIVGLAMRLSSIAHLYRVRLKARLVLVQELLAVLGLAVGVALLFASQVASASLNGSVRQLTNGIVGQLAVPAAVARSARLRSNGCWVRCSAFQVSGPRCRCSRSGSSVIGPAGRAGRRPDRRRSALRERRRSAAATFPLRAARPSACACAARTDRAGDRRPARCSRSSSRSARASSRRCLPPRCKARISGALVNSPVAVAPLAYAQKLTGMRGRITRIFVAGACRAGPLRCGPGLAQVGGESSERRAGGLRRDALRQAAEPINQSTATFAAICALVGFMFAYCAMLLTMPLRQGLIRSLRRNGATRLETVQTLLFDALVLAGLACIVGLALGEAISLTVFHPDAGYLSFGFPIGSQRIVTWQNVAIAVGRRLLAACVGVLSPVREIFSRPSRRVSDAPKRLIGGWTIAALVAGLAVSRDNDDHPVRGAPDPRSSASRPWSLRCCCCLPALLDLVVAAFDRLQTVLGMAVDAHRRDRAALTADADSLARDRCDRSDRRVRQRHDPGSAAQPAARPRPPGGRNATM